MDIRVVAEDAMRIVEARAERADETSIQQDHG